jgi:hypothetical protein
VSFFAEGGREVPMVSGLGVDDLSRVLPLCIFTTSITCSCAAFSPKCPACVNVAFSHARASCWSALIVITPLGPGIFIVAYAVWMTAINFRRKGLSRMQLYPMLKVATLNINISLCLFSPIPQHTSRSICSMGVDDYHGMTQGSDHSN